MQQPIRYYITKSGDEPTVRSVKVSLGTAEDSPEPRPTTPAAVSPVSEEVVSPTNGVKRIVQDAIRKRSRPT